MAEGKDMENLKAYWWVIKVPVAVGAMAAIIQGRAWLAVAFGAALVIAELCEDNEALVRSRRTWSLFITVNAMVFLLSGFIAVVSDTVTNKYLLACAIVAYGLFLLGVIKSGFNVATITVVRIALIVLVGATVATGDWWWLVGSLAVLLPGAAALRSQPS